MEMLRETLSLSQVDEHRRDDCVDYNKCLRKACVFEDQKSQSWSCKGCYRYKLDHNYYRDMFLTVKDGWIHPRISLEWNELKPLNKALNKVIKKYGIYVDRVKFGHDNPKTRAKYREVVNNA